MQQVIVEQIKKIAETNNVSQEKIAEILAEIIERAYNKQIPDQKIKVTIDVDSGKINSIKKLIVVEDANEDYDDFIEIPLSEAKKINPEINVGEECDEPFDILNFFKKNEILTILQIFKQKLVEINNQKVYNNWKDRIGEIIVCSVEKYDPTKGFYTIDLDSSGDMGFMSKNESIPGEVLLPGESNKYQFYIKDVKQQSKGWPIILSRADANFVVKLLENEVPEIASGEIVINAIERIAGFKTKIAVSSQNTNYDPASVVVGPKGCRIKAISDILNGEKIEVLKYTEDKKQFLINACGAANLIGINYVEPKSSDEQAYATLITTEKLLPVIIGKKGNNIKIISKLVNCGIDINTEEEARSRNINFEPVVQTTTQTRPNSNYSSQQRQWNNNSQPKTPKISNMESFQYESQNILNELENLSNEELAEKYGVNLNIDIESAQTNHNSIDIQNDDLDDDLEMNEYLLSDEFSDEIANITDEDDKE